MERGAPKSVKFWRALGPGLITGAADDDPSGIATYSQSGAQFGYSLVWTMLLTLPFMAAIQIISAAIGWGTGKGLSANIRKYLPSSVLAFLVMLLLIANTINIAADLAAMGAGLALVVGGKAAFYAFGFGIFCLVGEVFIPYHRYAGYLKYLTFVLFIYVAATITVTVPWGTVLHALFLPDIRLTHEMQLTIVAVFGTTISPYLFFWQASQEAEESRLSNRDLQGVAELSPRAVGHISRDTWVGMAVSNLVGFFIIVTTAATLHVHGVTNIQTAEQAAEALRPIAGELTFLLFALGLVGTGLLAVPVLAGSAGYAVTEAIGMRGSLELPASKAKAFYAIVGAATIGGGLLALWNVNPIQMLFWSAVVNGIAAVPIMFAMMIVVRKHKLPLPRWVIQLGWCGTAIMTLAVLLLLLTSF